MNGNPYHNLWTDPDSATAPRLVKIVGDIAGVPLSKGHGKHKGDVVSLDFVKPGKRHTDDKGRNIVPLGDQIVNGRAGEIMSAAEVVSGLYLTRFQMSLHGYTKAEANDAYQAMAQDPIKRKKYHLMELGEALSRRNLSPAILKQGGTGDEGRTYPIDEVREALGNLPIEEQNRLSKGAALSPQMEALLAEPTAAKPEQRAK